MTEPLPVVWSERRRLPPFDQCTEGAYLTALVYGGQRAFPEGIYTDKERNALDAATPPDPPTGGSTFALLDIGSQRRYGRTLHRIPDGSAKGLEQQLRIAGQALAIAGRLSNLPAGHRLRRFDPDFTGGHAICVVTLGDGACQWYDPLAAMRFPGDRVRVTTVLQFAWQPSDARVIVGGAWQADVRLDRISRLRTRMRNLQLQLDAADDDTTVQRLRTRLATIRELLTQALTEAETDT